MFRRPRDSPRRPRCARPPQTSRRPAWRRPRTDAGARGSLPGDLATRPLATRTAAFRDIARQTDKERSEHRKPLQAWLSSGGNARNGTKGSRRSHLARPRGASAIGRCGRPHRLRRCSGARHSGDLLAAATNHIAARGECTARVCTCCAAIVVASIASGHPGQSTAAHEQHAAVASLGAPPAQNFAP